MKTSMPKMLYQSSKFAASYSCNGGCTSASTGTSNCVTSACVTRPYGLQYSSCQTTFRNRLFACFVGPVAQSVQRLATGWSVWKSNPGGGEVFRTRPDRPWGPRSLLYNGYRVCFTGLKWSGRGVDHPPPYSAEVEERKELYLYSPCRPSYSVLG